MTLNKKKEIMPLLPFPLEGLLTVSVLKKGGPTGWRYPVTTENLRGPEVAHWVSGTGDLNCSVQ